MGLYNVIEPCEYVDDGVAVQHVRPTAPYQPCEVDDTAAAPLVAEGKLSAYRPGGVEGQTGTALDGVVTGDGTAEEPAAARRKPQRRNESDGG